MHLLEPYAYGLAGKIRYLLRLVRGTYYLQTSGLVIVDNAWLPVHVAPHRAGTTVVQVWHAAGALKRFGADTLGGLEEPEATFLHRHYDYAIASGEAGREPWSRALRTPLERVLPLGTPRTDLFYDDAALAAAKARVLAAYPDLAGRTVVLYAPTFRGRGRAKAGSAALDAGGAAGDACRRPTRSSSSPTRTSTRPASATAGFDVVADPPIGHERLAGRGRHPRHGLLVVDLRVGAAAPATRPARGRPRGVRARPGAVSRLPDRDDRRPGTRHGGRRGGHRGGRVGPRGVRGVRRPEPRRVRRPVERADRRAVHPGARRDRPDRTRVRHTDGAWLPRSSSTSTPAPTTRSRS